MAFKRPSITKFRSRYSFKSTKVSLSTYDELDLQLRKRLYQQNILYAWVQSHLKQIKRKCLNWLQSILFFFFEETYRKKKLLNNKTIHFIQLDNVTLKHIINHDSKSPTRLLSFAIKVLHQQLSQLTFDCCFIFLCIAQISYNSIATEYSIIIFLGMSAFEE